MYVDDLVSPLRVVSVRDPAIDWNAMAEAGVTPRVYEETRDPGSVRELPGRQAVWFTLEWIDSAECGAIDSFPEARRPLEAFSVACSEVLNALGPGHALRGTIPVQTLAGGPVRVYWSNADRNRIQRLYGQELLYEIGFVAWRRARLGNVWSGGVPYTPPPFLQPVLDQIKRLSAEHRRISAGTESSESKASDSPNPSV